MADNELRHHTLKGFEWKEHKYIRKENGRYIYPEDLERMRRAAANRIKSTLSGLGASLRSKLSSSRAIRTSSRRLSSAKASSTRTVSSLKQRGRDLLSRLFSTRKASSAVKSVAKTTKRASSINLKKTIDKGKKALNKFLNGIAKKANSQPASKTVGKVQNNSAKTNTKKVTPVFSFARNEKTRKKEEPKQTTSQPSKPAKTFGNSSGLETSKKTSGKSSSRGSSRASSSNSTSRSTSEKETKPITDPEKMNPYLLFSKLADKLGEDFDSDWIKSQGKDGDLESGLRVVFSEQLDYDLSDRKIKELADYMEVEESLPSLEEAEELSPKELFDMMKKHNYNFQMSGEKIKGYVEDGKLTTGIDLVFSEEFGYDFSNNKLQELANYVEQHDKVESMSSSALINQLKQSERYKSLSLKALKDGASDKKLLTGIHTAFEEEYGYDLSDKKLKEIAKYLKSKAELDDTKDKGKKAVAKATKK